MKVRISSFINLAVILLLITACGGGKKSGISTKESHTTGWEYNQPDNGGFEVNWNAREQETGPGLVFIEGGTFSMGRVEQDLVYAWNAIPRRVTVSSFYMDETEIANVDYREYMYWISRVFVDYPEVYRATVPDTLCWRRPMAYNEPYLQYYFRHPAYNDYPLVGVTWLQADGYCVWRTDRVNENILIREGILSPDPNQIGEENFNTDAYLAGQYEGLVNKNLPSLDPNKESRRVNLEDGILLPKYRLPTESEWEFAALALIGNSYEERIYERRMYPWDGHNVRNDAKKYRGLMRANFVRGRGDMMGTAGDLNDNASIPGPIDSYWPNDYGLYCMAGNVSEWVEDIYRPMTFQDFEDFNPFRGNVFETYETDEEGNLAAKDSLGRLRTRPVSEEEAINRWNYKKAYYKNYKDGDYESSLIDGVDWTQDLMTNQEWNSQRMYAYDIPGQISTTLITDKSRVYKGGSWRDRAYWLSPGTRRFLDEDKSTDDIGFRCAMTRVGSPVGF